VTIAFTKGKHLFIPKLGYPTWLQKSY
jgi:SRSO17 transposase